MLPIDWAQRQGGVATSFNPSYQEEQRIDLTEPVQFGVIWITNEWNDDRGFTERFCKACINFTGIEAVMAVSANGRKLSFLLVQGDGSFYAT